MSETTNRINGQWEESFRCKDVCVTRKNACVNED